MNRRTLGRGLRRRRLGVGRFEVDYCLTLLLLGRMILWGEGRAGVRGRSDELAKEGGAVWRLLHWNCSLLCFVGVFTRLNVERAVVFNHLERGRAGGKTSMILMSGRARGTDV
jgi:hypothetical protein